MEELKQLIANLETQKRNYQNDLNAATDDEHAQSIVNELNIVRNKLSEKRHELAQLMEKEQQREAIIAEAQDPESSFSLTVGGYTVDFRVEAASEEAYQALSIVTRLKLQEIEEANQAEIKALKASYDSEIAHNAEVIRQLKEANNQLELDRTDFENKWKAATTQVNELTIDNQGLTEQNALQRQENAALKNTIEELRNQVSKPAVATNLDANALADAIAKANAAKPAVYNLREHNGHYLANLAETDEEIQINWINKGKYRVLSDEEAARFREEREEAKKAALESVPEVAVDAEPVSPPSMQFQTEDESAVQGHTPNGEMEAEPVGQAETFEQWATREINALKAAVYGVDANKAA